MIWFWIGVIWAAVAVLLGVLIGRSIRGNTDG